MISYRVRETGKAERGGDETAIELTGLLRQAGYSVFLDIHRLHTGDDWLSTITRAVQGCVAFIPIISSSYGSKAQSEYTYKEYLLAQSLKKAIMPVHHSGDYPPLDLALHMTTVQYEAIAEDRMNRAAALGKVRIVSLAQCALMSHGRGHGL